MSRDSLFTETLNDHCQYLIYQPNAYTTWQKLGEGTILAELFIQLNKSFY